MNIPQGGIRRTAWALCKWWHQQKRCAWRLLRKHAVPSPAGTSSDLKDLKNLQNSSGKLLSQRRPDAIVMDAGIRHHWKKLLLWRAPPA